MNASWRDRLTIAVAASLLTVYGDAAVQSKHPGPPVVVFAASSLTTALSEIAKKYQALDHEPVVLTFGATGALAQQILDGAPADVFLSGDEARVRSLEAAGRIEPKTKVSLLSNRLAIVVPRALSKQLTSAADLNAATFRRVAIGDPAMSAAGVYTRRYLEMEGVWRDLGPRLVFTQTVRAALTAVESGTVDAAIVFLSDALSSRRAAIALMIPRDRTPGIVYQAVITAKSKNKAAARRFLDYLRDADARDVFVREGFVALVSGYLRAPALK